MKSRAFTLTGAGYGGAMRLGKFFDNLGVVKSAALLAMASVMCLTACRAPQGGMSRAEIRRAQSSNHEDLFPAPLELNISKAALDDTARMLAGMEPADRNLYAEMRGNPGWREHQARLDELWREYGLRHELPIRQWAAQEIPDLQRADAVFYPFSGPDFLFIEAFFPRAETVVLCGLEPAEPLPKLGTLSGADIDAGLEGLRVALNNVMQFSFFITKDMRNDLQATRFRGVLPVLLVFMARSGYKIESVDTIRLDAGGSVSLANAEGGRAPGLLIRARAHGGGVKRVFYFTQDLSNGGLSRKGPFLSFVSQLGGAPVFTKSASYLMHEPSFSVIRGYILQHAGAVVQDPSGVPFRELAQAGWDIRLYGGYRGTLDIFRQYEDSSLREAYEGRDYPVKPLKYGIGYLYQPDSTSLIVARPGNRKLAAE